MKKDVEKIAYLRDSRNFIEMNVADFEKLVFLGVKNNMHKFSERDRVNVYLHDDCHGISIQVDQKGNKEEHEKDFIEKCKLCYFYSSSDGGSRAFYTRLQQLMVKKHANRS